MFYNLAETAVPNVFDWKQAIDYGIAVSVLIGCVVFLIKQNASLKVDLATKDKQLLDMSADYIDKYNKLLVNTIEALNKSSYSMENAPMLMKTFVASAIQDEVKKLKD